MNAIRGRLTAGKLLCTVGCALLVAGAFLPWAIAGEFTTAGIEHADGTITFSWGLLLGGIVLLRSWDGLSIAAAVFVGFVLTGVVVSDMFAPERFFPTIVLANASGYRVGVGLVLSLVGALLVLGSGILGALGLYYPDLGRRVGIVDRE